MELTNSGIHSALMNLTHANGTLSYFAAINPRHLPETIINIRILKRQKEKEKTQKAFNFMELGY